MAKGQTEKRNNNGRTEKGTFAKGNQAAKDKGRPKEIKAIRDWCRAKTPDAFNVLAALMDDTDQRASDRIKAALAIIAYGYGQPPQYVETGDDEKHQTIVVNLTK